MVRCSNCTKAVSLCVGFYVGTLHDYSFHQEFWPNLNSLLKYQIKLVLSSKTVARGVVQYIGFLGDANILNTLSRFSRSFTFQVTAKFIEISLTYKVLTLNIGVFEREVIVALVEQNNNNNTKRNIHLRRIH